MKSFETPSTIQPPRTCGPFPGIRDSNPTESIAPTSPTTTNSVRITEGTLALATAGGLILSWITSLLRLLLSTRWVDSRLPNRVRLSEPVDKYFPVLLQRTHAGSYVPAQRMKVIQFSRRTQDQETIRSSRSTRQGPKDFLCAQKLPTTATVFYLIIQILLKIWNSLRFLGLADTTT